MKNTKKKNKMSIIALAVLLVVVLVAGTLAYFTYSATIANKIKTGSVDVSTIEKFDPPTNPEAGAEIEKKVAVKNNSTFPLVVRVKLTPVWTKGANTLSNTFDATWAAQPGNAGQSDLAAAPVFANGALGSKWIAGADGWYYLANPLAAKTSAGEAMYSDVLLDHVKLHDNIFGTADKKDPYYQEALYTLTVDVEAVEASTDGLTGCGWTIPQGVNTDASTATSGSTTAPFVSNVVA